VALFNAGQYESARAEFGQAATADAVNPDAFYNLGSTYHKLGDAAQAEANYVHCLAFDPNHSQAQHAYTVLLLELGRTNDAYAAVDRWMAQSPGNPDAMVELAWLEKQAGKTQQANDILQQVIAINPRHPRALTELASLYESSHQSDRALALYQRALAANPNHPELSAKVTDLRASVNGKAFERTMAQNTETDSQRAGRDLRYQLR
jgi:tetratricopeptide (TPR) repeat protein